MNEKLLKILNLNMQSYCIKYKSVSNCWKNINDHLDISNVDVVFKKCISRKFLSNSGLHLKKKWWSLDSFCCSQNNYEKVSHKMTQFDKEKARGKKHNSSHSANSSVLRNNPSVYDRFRLNNPDRWITANFKIQSQYKFFQKQVWNAMRNCPG